YAGFGDDPGLLVIPGIEVTFKDGDFNVFGVDAELDWIGDICGGGLRLPRLKGNYQTSSDLMRRMAAQSLVNSINHPLLRPWAWEDGTTDLRNLHCLEIWNDPSWPDNKRDNPRAVSLWTDLLDAGYRLTGIGGSDYHRPAPRPGEDKPPERLGLPSTYVYAGELSGNAILESVRQHRVVVSMGARAAFEAQANGRTYHIGEDVGEARGEIKLTATVSDSPAPARATIVKNGGVVAEARVEGGRASLTCDDELTPAQPAWYRLDVIGDDGLMLAITNPIFAGPRQSPQRHTFGDFAAKYLSGTS
ncbi:MAG: CehA/McbA family metallohydrolase, partial [Chloroflexi bacterium]|nr:CehA/McbA family metallohydrolase [Chloroflexota bacterium]